MLGLLKMKTIFSILILLAAFSIQAATNLLSLTYVNGTNNGTAYYASNIFVPKQRFILQSLGITNLGYAGSPSTNGITNTIKVNIQLSVDGSNTNWVTLTTWSPNTTNAEVGNLDDDFDRIALPIRAQVITTNALGVSVFKQ